MEDQFQLLNNGQSVLKADFNTLGEVAALADDRVLAELFRLQPYDGSTVRRGILPFLHAAAGAAQFIAPNGASGSVLVSPFRAIIGSRTAVATDARKNWRDIRSAIAVGSTTLAQTVSIGANASGNPRWDMIYAAVAVDANTATVTRKIKDPTTKVITGTSVVTRLATTVTLGVEPGTPAASPDFPAAPADAAGTYYIPLGFVRVPDGFGAGSTVAKADIAETGYTVPLSSATGGASLRVPDQMYTSGGIALTAAKVQAWGATGTRPSMFLPPLLGGIDSIIIPLDLRTGSESHADNAVVDSRDWRGRLARWSVLTGGTNDFPWANGSAFNPNVALATAAANQNGQFGIGQTMRGAGARNIALIDGALISAMPDTSSITIYCDAADSGKLKVTYANLPNVTCIFWIDFTAPWGNAL